jgi:hypothetical protein
VLAAAYQPQFRGRAALARGLKRPFFWQVLPSCGGATLLVARFTSRTLGDTQGQRRPAVAVAACATARPGWI